MFIRPVAWHPWGHESWSNHALEGDAWLVLNRCVRVMIDQEVAIRTNAPAQTNAVFVGEDLGKLYDLSNRLLESLTAEVEWHASGAFVVAALDAMMEAADSDDEGRILRDARDLVGDTYLQPKRRDPLKR